MAGIKLAHGLADQLVWQRNRSEARTACSGLYFPTFSRGQCVVASQLEWTDSRLAFHVSRSVLPLRGLQDSIVQLIHAEVAKVPALLSATALTHRLPLTQEVMCSRGSKESNADQTALSAACSDFAQVRRCSTESNYKQTTLTAATV